LFGYGDDFGNKIYTTGGRVLKSATEWAEWSALLSSLEHEDGANPAAEGLLE